MIAGTQESVNRNDMRRFYTSVLDAWYARLRQCSPCVVTSRNNRIKRFNTRFSREAKAEEKRIHRNKKRQHKESVIACVQAQALDRNTMRMFYAILNNVRHTTVPMSTRCNDWENMQTGVTSTSEVCWLVTRSRNKWRNGRKNGTIYEWRHRLECAKYLSAVLIRRDITLCHAICSTDRDQLRSSSSTNTRLVVVKPK